MQCDESPNPNSPSRSSSWEGVVCWRGRQLFCRPRVGEVGKGGEGTGGKREGEGQTERRKAAKQIKNVSASVCEGGKKVNVLVPISQKGKESLRSLVR